MAVVAVSELVKTFGEGRAARRVLDGADLTVEAGEVVAILGRSGSGKSTLLHLIGGLDRPERGTIEVAGEPVSGAGERELSALRRRRIGFVFQFFHLLPELSGEANVLLPGRVRGADPAAAARGRELIDRLGLRPVAESLPARLSGGEQQRLSLALALVGRPEVAFLDEPTAGVDVTGRQVIREVVTELRDRGTCVLLATHELDEAERVADRVVIVDRGRVVADAPLSQLTSATRGAVVVRTPEAAALRDVLVGLGLTARLSAPDEVSTASTTPDEVGRAIAAHGIVVHGMHAEQSTLEDIFFQLTAPERSRS